MKRDNFALHKFAVYSLQQSRSLAKALLSNGMMKGKDEATIERAVKALSGRDVYFSHGSVINHREAKDLGLNIEYLPPDNEIWKKIWLLYCMYDHDCRRDRYMKVFEGPAISTSIAAPRLLPATS